MNNQNQKTIARFLLPLLLFFGLKNNKLIAEDITSDTDVVVYCTVKFKNNIEAEGLEFYNTISRLYKMGDKFTTFAGKQIVLSQNSLNNSFELFLDEDITTMLPSIEFFSSNSILTIAQLYTYTVLVTARLKNDNNLERDFARKCLYLFGQKGLDDSKVLYNEVVDEYALNPDEWNQWGIIISNLFEYEQNGVNIYLGLTSEYISLAKMTLQNIDYMENQISDYLKNR